MRLLRVSENVGQFLMKKLAMKKVCARFQWLVVHALASAKCKILIGSHSDQGLCTYSTYYELWIANET